MTIASASAAEATKLAELQRLRDRSPAIQPEEGRPPDRDCRGEMELRDVYFAYPARPSQPVLQGCSIQIQPEAVTALVGHSGCGKSTTMMLLGRFFEPSSGTVTVDRRVQRPRARRVATRKPRSGCSARHGHQVAPT